MLLRDPPFDLSHEGSYLSAASFFLGENPACSKGDARIIEGFYFSKSIFSSDVLF